MDEFAGKYLYGTSLLVTIGVPLLLLVTVIKPRYFIVILISTVFIRFNERFPVPLSIPQFAFGLSLVPLALNFSTIKENLRSREVRVFLAAAGFILLHTLVFHREDLATNLVNFYSGLICFLFIKAFLTEESGLVALCLVLVLCAAVICFEPVYHIESESPFAPLFANAGGRLKAWGAWNNANETALIACIGMGSLLLLTRLVRRPLVLLLAAPVAYLFVTVVLESQSRAGLITLLLIFSVYVVKWRSRLLRALVLAGALVGVLYLPALFEGRTDADASTRERADLRYEGVAMFKSHPLAGVGYNHAYEHTGGMAIHCTYIQSFAELGIVGGGLLVYLVYSLGRRIYLAWQRLGDRDLPRARSLLCTLSGIFVSFMFYLYFGNQLFSVIFFIMFAFASTVIDFIETELVMPAAEQADEVL
jgi:O-antigen ligase